MSRALKERVCTGGRRGSRRAAGVGRAGLRSASRRCAPARSAPPSPPDPSGDVITGAIPSRTSSLKDDVEMGLPLSSKPHLVVQRMGSTSDSLPWESGEEAW